MKISYQWLKVYCPDLAVSPTDLAERLLLAGFPVESIEAAGDDTVLDVEVTSNRPDLLGYIGMAREVAALTGATFTPPKAGEIGNPLSPTLPQRGRENTAGPDLAARAAIRVESPDCPYYTARIIENVTIGPSPAWLVSRLEAMGLRPINNVVDITNYVLFEHSQPLHAFDYDKLAGAAGAGKTIIIRRAKAGEKMVSIDGHLRELDPSMLVIADSTKPVAVAGVMGGLDTEVGPTTRTVLLESAYFDPMSVRATARKLALFSDSSFRFERGVDPAGIEAASNRAVDLLVELAGGKPLAGFARGTATQPGSADWATRSGAVEVSMRLSRLQKLIGMAVPTDRVMQILGRLALSPKISADGQTVVCSAPSFRPDIRREVDLIEEVARVEGYDKIPVRNQIELEVRPPNKRQATIRRLARGLCGLGLFETVSITFVTGDRAELFAFARGGAGHLAVTHSSRKAENALRRSLLPSLLAARRHNETVQVRRADLFEIASVFDPPADGAKLPEESLRLGFVTDGDFREARGIVEQVVALVSRSAKLTFQPADRTEFVAGRGAAILLSGQPIGLIGQVSESARTIFDLRREQVTVAEIDIEPLLVLAGEPKTCTPLARFPAIERDLSILVDEPVSWQQVEQAIRGSAPAELEAIEFADLFRGKQFPAGKKSFTFTLRYRSADGTLTNELANEFAGLAVKALADQTGAALRDK